MLITKNIDNNFFNIIKKSIKNKSKYVCVWGAGYTAFQHVILQKKEKSYCDR